MIVEIKVPSPGESITEVQIASWLVEDGSLVKKDQEIAEIDSDKATLSISAEVSGKIKLLAEEGDTVDIGTVSTVKPFWIFQSRIRYSYFALST